ncbi:MAG TPA: hypothetical protein VIJ11_13370 [Galbitalea sp.]
MSQRLVPLALFAVVASSAALLLSGCFLIPSPSPAPTSAPPPTETTNTPAAPSATPTAISTPSGTATAAGCPSNSATMPAGAVSHPTIDVDGDGVADTEWMSSSPTLEFGVTTASGATFSYPLATASPAGREGFISRLNDHRIVSIVDDNRAAYLHFFVNCAWVETKTPQGAPYPLDFNDFAGTGSGVGCAFGYVESFQAVNSGGSYTVTQTPVDLNGDGSRATPGAPLAIATGVAATDAHVKAAQTISCEGVTVANGGVTLP